MSSKQVEVQIMGQSYLLACPEGGEQRLLEAPIFFWNARPASGGFGDELDPPVEAYESAEDAFSEAVETIMTREPDADGEAQP
jgi:hypothetical protein